MAGRRARRVPKRLTLGSEAAGKWSEANMETDLYDDLYDEQLGLTLSESLRTAGRELAGTIGTAFSAVTGAASSAAAVAAAAVTAPAATTAASAMAAQPAPLHRKRRNADTPSNPRKRRRAAAAAAAAPVAAGGADPPAPADAAPVSMVRQLWSAIQGQDSAGAGEEPEESLPEMEVPPADDQTDQTSATDAEEPTEVVALEVEVEPNDDQPLHGESVPAAAAAATAAAAAAATAAAAAATAAAPAAPAAAAAVDVAAATDGTTGASTSQAAKQLPLKKRQKKASGRNRDPPWDQPPPGCTAEIDAMMAACRRTAAQAQGFRREILNAFARQCTLIMTFIPGELRVDAAQKKIACIAQHKAKYYHCSEQFARDWSEDATGGSVPTETSVGFYMPALKLCSRINEYEIDEFKPCPPSLLAEAAKRADDISRQVTSEIWCKDCGQTKASFGLKEYGRRSQWCRECCKKDADGNERHPGAIDVRNTPCVCCEDLTQPHHHIVDEQGKVSRPLLCGGCAHFCIDAQSDKTSCAGGCYPRARGFKALKDADGNERFKVLQYMFVDKGSRHFFCGECGQGPDVQKVLQTIGDAAWIRLVPEKSKTATHGDRQPKRKATGRRKSRADPALPTTGAAPAESTTGVEVALPSTGAAAAPSATDVEVALPATGAAPAPALQQVVADEEDEVERILDKRWSKGGVEYLVRWKDSAGEDDDTWEPNKNLENAPVFIDRFEREKTSKEMTRILGFAPASARRLARAAHAQWENVTANLKCGLTEEEANVLRRFCEARDAAAPTATAPAHKAKRRAVVGTVFTGDTSQCINDDELRRICGTADIKLRCRCVLPQQESVMIEALQQNFAIAEIDLRDNWTLPDRSLKKVLELCKDKQESLGSLTKIQMDTLQQESKTICVQSPRVISDPRSTMQCFRCKDGCTSSRTLLKLGHSEDKAVGRCVDKDGNITKCRPYVHLDCGLLFCEQHSGEHVTRCPCCRSDLGSASVVARGLESNSATRVRVVQRAKFAEQVQNLLQVAFDTAAALDIAVAVEAENHGVDKLAAISDSKLWELLKKIDLSDKLQRQVLHAVLLRELRNSIHLAMDHSTDVASEIGRAWFDRLSFAEALDCLTNRERLLELWSNTSKMKRLTQRSSTSTCPEIDDEVQKVMEVATCTEDIARKAITKCRSYYQGDVSQRAIELLCNFDLDSDHDDSEDDDDSNLSEDGDAETMDMEEDRDDDQAENSPTFATSRSRRVWTWADFESMLVVPPGLEYGDGCGEHDEHDPLQCPVTSQVFSLWTREQQLSFLNSQKQRRETQSKSELRQVCEGLPPPTLSSGGTKEEVTRRLLRWSIGRSLESDYKAEEEQNQRWLEQYCGDVSSDYESPDEDDSDDEDYDSGPSSGASTGPKPAARAGQSAASAAKSPRNRRSAAAAAASATSHNSGRARGSGQFARSEGTFTFKDNGATLELRYILVKGCYWLSLPDVILFVNPLERSSVGRRLENLKKANPDLEVQSHKSRQCIRAGWIREVVVTLRKMDRKANHRSRMHAGEEDFQDCLAYEWLLTKERELRQSCPVSIPPSCFAVVFDDSSTTVCTAEASPNADSSSVDSSVKNHNDLLQQIRSYLASSTADANAMREEELFELKHSLDEKLNMLVPPDEFGIHW
eukprot:COSAG06_NODE_3085_length_5880_cov_3.544197_1_plen_1652_part_10